MNRMILNVGDWSKDGHNINEKILVDVNVTIDEIRQGYKDSCKLTGVQFNHNEDYTEGQLGNKEYRRSPRQICTDYGECDISNEAYDILVSHGMDISKFIDEDFEDDDNEEDVTRNIMCSKDFAEIWFRFVKLSIPHLEFEIVKDSEYPSINGMWNKDLNCQFGYGLFD